jgi:NADPH-dependent ferric siderophore reductase
MALNETLKDKQIQVNDSHASDVKENLKQFFDTHETIVETKKQLEPLFTEVVNGDDVADKIESTINKEHIKNLLVAMKNEFAAD